jgi:hypothetical protein
VSVLDQDRAPLNNNRSQLNGRWLGGASFLRLLQGNPRLHPRPRAGVPGGVSLVRRSRRLAEAPPGAVVATDRESAHANYDNGRTPLQSESRS